MSKFELGQKLFIVGRETVEINCPVCKVTSSFEAPNTCEGCLGTSVVQISVPVAQRVEVRATNNLRGFDCEEDVFGSEDEIIEKELFGVVTEEGRRMVPDPERLFVEEPNLDDYERCGCCAGWGTQMGTDGSLAGIIQMLSHKECHNCDGTGFITKEKEKAAKQRSEHEEREEYVASELRQYNVPDGVN